MSDRKKQTENTHKDIRRLERHEKNPATWVGIAFYGGIVGLLFIVPIVAGAYIGRWLDSLFVGYSVRWTVSLIILGIVIGTYNTIRFIKGKS